MECNVLSSRTSFESYITLLQNNTNSDFSLVKDCRAEVCGALWGSGNPDVSGIGMAIGYLLESSISLLILCALIWTNERPSKNARLARMMLANASRAFYDNAIFFTFAIQAASIATLTRVDFGISADGMGALTMQITWLVSMLTLLPLLPLVLRPETYQKHSKETVDEGGGVDDGRAKSSTGSPQERSSALTEARQDLRFLFFVICWAMAFCPFFSRMGGTFGESKIGDSQGSAISIHDWKKIEDTCFLDVKKTSPATERFVTSCGIMSYLLVSIIVISKILASILEGYETWLLVWLRRIVSKRGPQWSASLYHTLCVAVFALLAVQLWAFFRVRQVQKDINVAAGVDFPDGRWTFGQIVAVTVFAPVLVEVIFSWRKRSILLS